MKNLSAASRFFFAIGIVDIAIEHFIYHGFLLGRAPVWPQLFPGKLTWAYLSGTMFIPHQHRPPDRNKSACCSITGAVLIFLWAFFRHIAVLTDESFLSGAWTSAGKSIVFIGGFLEIAPLLLKYSLQATHSL